MKKVTSRQKVFDLLDEHPELLGKQTKVAEILGIPRGTVASSMASYRAKGALRPKEPNSGEIADALLSRVVEAITRYDSLSEEVGELRECKSRVKELEKALDTEKGEKERILKIHNDQVKSRKLTDAEVLRKLARL